MMAVVCHSVPYSIPLVHTSSLSYVHCNESFGLVRGLSLLSATLPILDSHWDSSSIVCCPMSWRSCDFDFAELIPSWIPIVHRWDKYCQFKALDAGLSGGCVAQPASSPMPTPPGTVLLFCPDKG